MKFRKGVFHNNVEGLLSKMAEDMEKELKKDPNNKDILYRLGITYLRLGKTEKVMSIYKTLREIDITLAQDLLDRLYDI